ncbi:hypothetical protein RX141_14380 (plasmid) [Enterococcus faecalis]|nr:hypothetical protein [Enterococcus faecalis]WOA50616.1 hypothetical protein RX141_14380 [Enterococcus faecalis]
MKKAIPFAVGLLFCCMGGTGTTKQKIAVVFGNGYLESFLQ